MSKLLTKEEIVAIKSMNLYWQEVIKRDDTSPLHHELQKVIGRFGTKILFILADYAEQEQASHE